MRNAGMVQKLHCVFMLQVCNQSSEVDVFWTLSSIMRNFSLRDFFVDHLPLLKQMMFCFSHLISAYMPDLSTHLVHSNALVTHNIKETLGIDPLFFSAEWFSTVFSYTTNMDVAARIWDVFLYEGREYLYRVALAILKFSEGTTHESNQVICDRRCIETAF